jgi:transposase-like protein
LVLREAGLQSDDDIRDKSVRILEATVSPLDVSPGTPRRRWSVAARERIVREAMAPGATVSAVARAHGLNS